LRAGLPKFDAGASACLGDDVVMRWADTGREEIIISRTQRLPLNLGRDIRNDAHLAQIDADLGQVIRDISDVWSLVRPKGSSPMTRSATVTDDPGNGRSQDGLLA
jgi:hypothetical protein